MGSLLEKGYYKQDLSESERKKLEDFIKESIRKTINEEGEKNHPGITKTNTVQNKEKDINKEYQKNVEDKMKDYSTYDSGEEDSDEDYVRQDIPKFEPNEDQQEYIEDIERGGGPQHLRYDNTPDDKFKERAVKAIEGDSSMGNKTYGEEENGNTAPMWGASSEDFGERIIKQANRRKKRTDDSAENLTSFGDDIEVSDKDKQTRDNAFKESLQSNKDLIKETKNTNKMKRLNFAGKREFNGKDNALKLIPESYKVDGKKFEMTDGNESYTVRWEVDDFGEGKPIVLESTNKQAMNEDIGRVKELMNFNSKDTLGVLKGEQRIEENKKFDEIKQKTQNILTEEKERENKIVSLNEVEGKLKKKHINQLAKKPLFEAAKKMADNRLSKYSTKFKSITDAYPLEDKLYEGMNYDQLNYVIEEGIKEASRKSLLKEDYGDDKSTLTEDKGYDEYRTNAKETKPGEEDVNEEDEVTANVEKELAGGDEKLEETGEQDYDYEKSTDYRDEEGEVPGEQGTGPDERTDEEYHMDEQEAGYDPSAAAGAGAEQVVNWTIKTLKRFFDREKIMKILNHLEEKLGEIGTGAGGATGTGTGGVKREGEEITESELDELIDEQHGGYDPSGAAGAGAERVVNGIAKALTKLGDKEQIRNAFRKIKDFFEKAGEAASGGIRHGESEEKSGSLIDEGYYEEAEE